MSPLQLCFTKREPVILYICVVNFHDDIMKHVSTYHNVLFSEWITDTDLRQHRKSLIFYMFRMFQNLQLSP